MESVYLYLLKMFVCSTLLFGYYRVALYNVRFHQWNRFYLLAAMALSVIVPCIRVPLAAGEQNQNLSAIITYLPWNAGVHPAKTELFTWYQIAVAVSVMVSLIFFVRVVWGVVRILLAFKTYPAHPLQQHVTLLMTRLPEAPFSFFHLLFWREDIDPASESGKRMLTHELTHIQEYHSVDKIFTSLLLCVFWINPLFWLMRNELNMIHEFLADRKAITNQNGPAFAEMILQALPLYHTSRNSLINPFFSSQIKRRLFMISTSKQPSFSYVRRVSGLVVMICSAFALAVSIQHAEAQTAGKNPRDSSHANQASKTVHISADTDTVHKTGTEGSLISVKKTRITATGKSAVNNKNGLDSNKVVLQNSDKKIPIYILEGKEISVGEMDKINAQNIKEVHVLKGEQATAVYGEKGKDGVVEITMKPAGGETVPPQKMVIKTGASLASPLVYVNGKEASTEAMKSIPPADIESINVLKGETAIKKYGEKAKDGAIEIYLKKPVSN